jgi:formate hydrogenlyase subunit 6/NADH:ubiquinone oxidoreductase subunit I
VEIFDSPCNFADNTYPIWIASEAIKQLLRKPITLKYPFEKVVPPLGFRGRPVWDMRKCIGCGLCSRVCPSAAVEMIGRGLEAEIKHRVDRCMFCAQCAESCPRSAITMTNEYELAGRDRSKMLYWYKRET